MHKLFLKVYELYTNSFFFVLFKYIKCFLIKLVEQATFLVHLPVDISKMFRSSLDTEILWICKASNILSFFFSLWGW